MTRKMKHMHWHEALHVGIGVLVLVNQFMSLYLFKPIYSFLKDFYLSKEIMFTTSQIIIRIDHICIGNLLCSSNCLLLISGWA